MIVRELLTVFGVKYEDHGAKKAEESIQGLIKNARVLVGAVAASAIVVGIKHLVEEQVEFAKQLERTSKRLGIQTDSLQELRYAAEQAGIEQHALDMGMQKFMIRTAQAAQGTGSAVNSLKELGVQLKDSTGNLRTPADLIAQAADGFAKLTSQADKARIAQTLFEEEGVQLIDMLQNGSAGLKKMRQEAHQLGAVMEQESIQSSRNLGQVLMRIGYALSSLKRSLVDALMPALQITARGCEYLVTGVNHIIQHTTILKGSLTALSLVAGLLATKMVIAFAPVILTFTAIAAAVSAVILVVDDLYALFKGGDSISARFLGAVKAEMRKNALRYEAERQKHMPQVFQGLIFRNPNPRITNSSSVQNSTQQNLKIDVHVQSNANPLDMGKQVARMVGSELDRVNRNTYLALVPQ